MKINSTNLVLPSSHAMITMMMAMHARKSARQTLS